MSACWPRNMTLSDVAANASTYLPRSDQGLCDNAKQQCAHWQGSSYTLLAVVDPEFSRTLQASEVLSAA
jgi:hypothetical protein